MSRRIPLWATLIPLVLGVLLGTVRQRTGRVWPGWVLHTVNNLLVFAAG